MIAWYSRDKSSFNSLISSARDTLFGDTLFEPSAALSLLFKLLSFVQNSVMNRPQTTSRLWVGCSSGRNDVLLPEANTNRSIAVEPSETPIRDSCLYLHFEAILLAEV